MINVQNAYQILTEFYKMDSIACVYVNLGILMLINKIVKVIFKKKICF